MHAGYVLRRLLYHCSAATDGCVCGTDPEMKTTIPPEWPGAGPITFENVTLRYSKHTPVVLKGLSFEINAKEKIGIVGRTGSGKSSVGSCACVHE